MMLTPLELQMLTNVRVALHQLSSDHAREITLPELGDIAMMIQTATHLIKMASSLAAQVNVNPAGACQQTPRRNTESKAHPQPF